MPMINNHMIQRENLMHLLEELSREQIIYICAPAGYGKTVAVREWLTRKGYNNQFVSLDKFNNDLVYFCSRFCTALQSCQPENAALQRIISHSAFDGAPEEFTVRALSVLSAVEHICFIIDDLHFIHNERILRLLTSFLKKLPENFRIILISRNELPSCFSELWLRGNLMRIMADDLRFNREEIILLYKERGHPITPEKADEILRFTDGWAIGISAVLLSASDLHGENMKYLDEFIYTNVWWKWDEEIREFMLKTAIIREMTPSLCMTITDNPDSEKILNQLVQQNAFISRTKNNVYRYHQLFYDYLNHMLNDKGEEFTRILLEKAGGWYLTRQDFHSAIECFIRCGNYAGIAGCIGILFTMGREYVPTETLFPIVRAPIVQHAAKEYPYLYIMLLWAAFSEGRAADMAEYSDRYYSSYSEIVRFNPDLAGSIIFVRLVDFRNTVYELAQYASKIYVNLTEKGIDDKRDMLETLNQNLPLLHRGTRDFSECATEKVEENISGIESAMGGLFGDESHLLEECLVAGLLYEQGQLEKAYAHATAAIAEIKEDFVPETKFFTMAILVYIMDSLEQQAQADHILQNIADMIEENGAYYLNYNFKALKIRRSLEKGDMNAASYWLEEHETQLYNGLYFYKSYGHITTCRAYITKGDYDSAIILLKKVLTLMETYNRPLDVIETKILLSIAYWKKKRKFQDEAMRYLEESVLTAYQYGYTQIFVNEGAELFGMLHRLQKRMQQKDSIVPANFVKMLYLKTLEHRKGGLTSGQPVPQLKFTEKQKEIMRLQCEGKTYKEIADTMEIKIPTLRSHLALIYKKLDVTCEADAVMKIKSTGILTEE